MSTILSPDAALTAPRSEDPASSAPAPCQPQTPRWGFLQRIAFRFACAYFLIYNFPFPLNYIPGTGTLQQAYTDAWHKLVPWVARTVLDLGYEITVFPGGSGDTTYNYVEVLCFAAFAAIATVLWSLVAFRARNHARMHHLLRIYLRYAVAMIMLGYGLAKVLPPRQFQPAMLDRLIEPFSDFSPMGLLWTFMGYSVPYTIFSGLAETLGGTLLLWRRTATAGAIVSACVMLNIVMLNFCYDTPVKLYSSHILLMNCFLILPDSRRLASVLVLNCATHPTVLHPERRWLRWTLVVPKLALLGYLAYSMVTGREQMAAMYEKPKPSLFGIYEVESFTRNGVEVPPLLTDAARWRTVVINKYGGFTIKMMDDSKRGYRLEEHLDEGTINLVTGKDGSEKYVFTLAQLDLDHVILDGKLKDDDLSLQLRRVDHTKFLIESRGFHWINELPMNR